MLLPRAEKEKEKEVTAQSSCEKDATGLEGFGSLLWEIVGPDLPLYPKAMVTQWL